jgi:hypothetical protein
MGQHATQRHARSASAIRQTAGESKKLGAGEGNRTLVCSLGNKHNKIIRPVTDRDKKGRYQFRDGRDKEITLADLRQIAVKEKK